MKRGRVLSVKEQIAFCNERGIDGLFCVAALSSSGKPCLRVLDGDVRRIGLGDDIQHVNVPAELLELGYSAVILPDKATGAVNVPLTMAHKLKACGVLLVDEALSEASPTEYEALKKREKLLAEKAERKAARLAKKSKQ